MSAAPSRQLNHAGALVAALAAGALLAAGARTGPVALLAAVAVVQAALGVAWVFGTGLPGRVGGLVIAALAAGGADVAVSLFPHGRLGALLIVFGLAVPVVFAHQLVRGTARMRVVDSAGGAALLVVAVVGLAALPQLRHEFSSASVGAHVVAAVVAACAGALVIGHLVDMITPMPRFDPAVSRGLLAVIASAGLGGSIGHLMLSDQAAFTGGRAAFTGAALGALAGLLAVAVAFIASAPTLPAHGFGRRVQPIATALLPLAVLAPVAFLLCLAVRV